MYIVIILNPACAIIAPKTEPLFCLQKKKRRQVKYIDTTHNIVGKNSIFHSLPIKLIP